MPVFIDTVAWVHLDSGRVLCARPRGKDIFYVPGGKREGGESDLQTLLREIAEELTVHCDDAGHGYAQAVIRRLGRDPQL